MFSMHLVVSRHFNTYFGLELVVSAKVENSGVDTVNNFTHICVDTEFSEDAKNILSLENIILWLWWLIYAISCSRVFAPKGEDTKTCLFVVISTIKRSDGLMDKVSASQPRDRRFGPNTAHDHDSSCDTSTGWFQSD